MGRYFHDAFNAVWTAGMYRDLIKLRKKYEDYEIWVGYFKNLIIFEPSLFVALCESKK